MALTGSTNEQKIWNYLLNSIGNKYGAAGLMGNLYAESALKPNNLQDSYEKILSMTDEIYTSRTNSGDYTNFIRDSAGYGLAQWTFWTRKQALLQYARSKNVSIDDLEMQLEFLIKELKTYTSVWNTLVSATSVLQASNKVLINYEAPANSGSSVQTLRASYGQNYYNKYAEVAATAGKEEASTIWNLALKSAYSKYLTATSMHYISNSGSDENKGYRGGKAGDQTGSEWVMRSWYNRPWDCVLRYPDIKVGLKIAELSCAAAENDHIGYDQNERYTYWSCLQKVSYDPKKITTNCEADCSAGVIANVKAVGYLLNISKLKDLKATYTGDMKQGFINAGFQVLTGSNYLTSPNDLLPGDILLNVTHHTACNVSIGVNARNTTDISGVITSSQISSTLKYGSTGSLVKTMQEMLIAVGYDLGSYGADGDFGSATLTAVRKFQSDHGLVVDGIYGPASKAKLEAAYKEATTTTNLFTNFTVKVTTGSLNIRKGPGTSYQIVGAITDRGVYTIVDKQGSWGKLKSGAGWISLNYTKKV